MTTIDRYAYEELKASALAPGATKEDRLNLYKWFDRYSDMYWNGECYDMDEGYSLYPVYEHDEENDQYEVVDAEIR